MIKNMLGDGPNWMQESSCAYTCPNHRTREPTIDPPAMAFVGAVARLRGPRQGANVRVCVSTRERICRSLLIRVVRRALPSNVRGSAVVIGAGVGRSAYVGCDIASVRDARTRGKLGRSLRTQVPREVFEELERVALANEALSTSLSAADAFARDAPNSAVDEVAAPLCGSHNDQWLW